MGEGVMEGVLCRVMIILFLLSFFYYLWDFWKRRTSWAPYVFLLFAFIFHTILLIHRCIDTGHPPYRTLFESVLTVTWFLTLTQLIYIVLTKSIRPIPVSLLITIIGVYFAEFIMTKDKSPLSPALQSLWFNIHVPTMLFSYSVLALAISEDIMWRIRKEGNNNSRKLVLIGFPILGIGIMLGSVWAESAWGRYWGWDAKEVWSLITFLGYLSYIHVNFVPEWKKKFEFPLHLLSFLFLLITYFGVNYIVRIFSVESLHTF